MKVLAIVAILLVGTLSITLYKQLAAVQSDTKMDDPSAVKSSTKRAGETTQPSNNAVSENNLSMTLQQNQYNSVEGPSASSQASAPEQNPLQRKWLDEIDTLTGLNDEEAISRLSALILHPDRHIRHYAIDALADVGSEQAIDSLARLVEAPGNNEKLDTHKFLDTHNVELTKLDTHSPHWLDTQRYALDAIGEIGGYRGALALERVLNSANPQLRIRALDVASELPPELGQPLINLALQDSEPQIRITASKLLNQRFEK